MTVKTPPAGRLRLPTSPPVLPTRSFASSPQIRERMQQQLRTGTAPEMAVRRAVHRHGLRYFVNRRPVPSLRRTADLVFPSARVAVFVDGCFWHGCPHHGRGQLRENVWYWPEKIASNQRRDRDTCDQLAEHGWLAVRVWEHDDAEAAAALIQRIILERRAAARAMIRG